MLPLPLVAPSTRNRSHAVPFSAWAKSARLN
jgi:hypothetical protein